MWFCSMFGRATHLCSRRGNNQLEQTIFSSTAASLSCPESTNQHKHWWENTHPQAAEDIWWERQHFKQTSNRQFTALPIDSTISLPVKEFFQSLLSKTIHVNTLLMFSRHERPMCVCLCWITNWLALKKKAKWAAYLDSF